MATPGSESSCQLMAQQYQQHQHQQQQWRRTSNRVKMSRDLMVRLSLALASKGNEDKRPTSNESAAFQHSSSSTSSSSSFLIVGPNSARHELQIKGRQPVRHSGCRSHRLSTTRLDEHHNINPNLNHLRSQCCQASIGATQNRKSDQQQQPTLVEGSLKLGKGGSSSGSNRESNDCDFIAETNAMNLATTTTTTTTSSTTVTSTTNSCSRDSNCGIEIESPDGRLNNIDNDNDTEADEHQPKLEISKAEVTSARSKEEAPLLPPPLILEQIKPNAQQIGSLNRLPARKQFGLGIVRVLNLRAFEGSGKIGGKRRRGRTLRRGSCCGAFAKLTGCSSSIADHHHHHHHLQTQIILSDLATQRRFSADGYHQPIRRTCCHRCHARRGRRWQHQASPLTSLVCSSSIEHQAEERRHRRAARRGLRLLFTLDCLLAAAANDDNHDNGWGNKCTTKTTGNPSHQEKQLLLLLLTAKLGYYNNKFTGEFSPSNNIDNNELSLSSESLVRERKLKGREKLTFNEKATLKESEIDDNNNEKTLLQNYSNNNNDDNLKTSSILQEHTNPTTTKKTTKRNCKIIEDKLAIVIRNSNKQQHTLNDDNHFDHHHHQQLINERRTTTPKRRRRGKNLKSVIIKQLPLARPDVKNGQQSAQTTKRDNKTQSFEEEEEAGNLRLSAPSSCSTSHQIIPAAATSNDATVEEEATQGNYSDERGYDDDGIAKEEAREVVATKTTFSQANCDSESLDCDSDDDRRPTTCGRSGNSSRRISIRRKTSGGRAGNIAAELMSKRRSGWVVKLLSSILWLFLAFWFLLPSLPQIRLSHAQLSPSFGAAGGVAESSSGDELSRAVLATMSTQAPAGELVTSPLNSSGFLLNPSTDRPLLPVGLRPNQPQVDLGVTAIVSDGSDAPPAAAAPEEENELVERVFSFLRIFIMSAIIIGDICGNSLVILSVCRHSKLRMNTNWFVVSLACADILVALFAMTFNASVIISGRWLFNSWVCDFWNACDVLASTASILHLCCISIDRYVAIMRPLDYPMKITTRRVMYTLCGVWIASALLSYLPIFTGVYTTSDHIKWLEENPDQCEFVVNRVYAIVSSSISFWIPCCIMIFVYYRIFREANRQEKFIYKAQSIMPAPIANHNHHNHGNHQGGGGNHHNSNRTKQRRSKSIAVSGSGGGVKQLSKQQQEMQSRKTPLAPSKKPMAASTASTSVGGPTIATTNLSASTVSIPISSETIAAGSAAGTAAERANLLQEAPGSTMATTSDQTTSENKQLQVVLPVSPTKTPQAIREEAEEDAEVAANAANEGEEEEEDSNSGQSTPTNRSISKMKREHKAAKTLGIIMGVFILCWLPFFSWYTPTQICGRACDHMVPKQAITILFWIGYFNSTLNPIIYAYFNHEFRDAFKKTLQWLFCCCNDLKCLRVNRPNDNQHYNCTYRSTQEIGLVNS